MLKIWNLQNRRMQIVISDCRFDGNGCQVFFQIAKSRHTVCILNHSRISAGLNVGSLCGFMADSSSTPLPIKFLKGATGTFT